MVELDLMKRARRPFASRSTFLIVLSTSMLLGPGGLASPAWGACPDARFARQVVVPAGGAVEGISVADFNGDGDLDLAVTNFSSGGAALNGVAILLGDAEGGLGAPTSFAVGHGATRIVESDFNGDGEPDVAVLNTNDGTVSILLGDGFGGLGTHEVSLEVTDRSGAAASDATIITVEDTTVPLIDSIIATPDTLSPPNRELVQVSIRAVATDACDVAPTCRIVSVSGHPDPVIIDPGPEPSPARLVVGLRALRAGAGAFTIDVSCSDVAGNTSSGRTTVGIVPGRRIRR